MNTNPLLNWSRINPDNWSFGRQQTYTGHVVFEISKLPNFAEPRFKPLGEGLEDRKSVIARHQMEMLMKLHDLGPGHAISLRYRRDGNRLRLYIIIKTTGSYPAEDRDIDLLATRIQQMFPPEYHPHRVMPERDELRWAHATDLSWARYVEELLKPEDVFPSDTWPFYYVISLWQSVGSNDMESLCRTLLNFDGDATVEVLLTPVVLEPIEREFVNTWIQRMRESVSSGERVTNRDGQVLRTFPPRPSLRGPLENYEKLIDRYNRNRLFLYAFRVFASDAPSSVSSALIANASRSKPLSIRVNSGNSLFQSVINSAQLLDFTPEVHNDWWDKRPKDKDGDPEPRPFKVQRLHRIADIEEAAPFWRLPIPVVAGFPGFDLDIGDFQGPSSQTSKEAKLINLGHLTDDPSKSQLNATFNRENLAKHGLIVGVPGSGKTTTMFNLLHQLWVTENPIDHIPFIVLEPAKTEYRAMKELDGFRDELLIFTLGDERISPFRFNPFEVPKGIPLESHISRLNACFVGAFNLFDPLPLLLDKSIRITYEMNGWFDDSIGGDLGLRTPKLSDLVEVSDRVIKESGYSDKLRDDFNAALLQRLESLRRGSKGRMLDTQQSIPFDDLMKSPIVMELDALNEDEKSLMMMFILTFVYEYAKSTRKSGSPLKHVLVVEEAHNLIGRGDSNGSEFRANPKEQAIRLFVRMLAEMRALGQGILIADQLPTALAPEAVKQTNLKVLMRLTSMDDRVEIGNTMDVSEAELKDVVRFKSGQAYIYIEEWDRVRQVKTPNFKDIHNVGEPPDDLTITELMNGYEESNPKLFMPFAECSIGCRQCNRRLRNQAERFVRPLIKIGPARIDKNVQGDGAWGTLCKTIRLKAMAEAMRLKNEYGEVDALFPFCAFVHFLNLSTPLFQACERLQGKCECKTNGRSSQCQVMITAGQKVVQQPLSQ